MKKWIAIAVLVIGLGVVAFPFVRNYLKERKGAELIQNLEIGEATMIVDIETPKEGELDSWVEADGMDDFDPEEEDDFSALSLSGELVDAEVEIGDEDIVVNPEDETESELEIALDANVEAESLDFDALKRKKLVAIGKLEIPRIDSVQPIVEGAGKTELNYAVGHVTNTADFARIGNCVLAGHRNYTFGSMFNRLGEMQTGDEIIVTMRDGTRATYVVYETLDVKPGVPEISSYHKDERRLTLMTCTPVGVGSHRLLVRARLDALEVTGQASNW